ncbi:aminotransferase class V-fold PLP-dependent enzyme [Corynebacterium poyangense]|uniref:Aminotransferase class V-fold PLP-dependent enzyme n=1 Tax=Corynebacterium poyangense TaxID=2684405 RepID=A0A7H0SLD2_9CORY|nr:aminotransferase class V-fold PLP-dependent enzyme [Corynebacterium poyangense]QNQ89357.1 aminotransferase class V-fold PLP-dependent enzyme [Corynebacterium poyangense]
MSYDVARVRGLYVSITAGWTYLNAHQRPQIPERVSSAVARAFRTAPQVTENSGGYGSHSRHSQPGHIDALRSLHAARMAIADLCGATADRVLLGTGLAELYRQLAAAMQPLLGNSSSVVLSQLDPPELNAAFTQNSVAEVRCAQPDLGTGELPAWQYRTVVDGSTRLVSVGAAHSSLGPVAPVRRIAEITHQRSRAWVLVDATAYAMYRPISPDYWDADIIAIDVAKLGGPEVAALVFRDTAMLKRLRALNPHCPEDSTAKLEYPVSAGLAGGVPALVDHLANLVDSPGTRRTRLLHSMRALARYAEDLGYYLLRSLESLPAVHILGVSGEAAGGGVHDRIPCASFLVHGVPAATVYQRLIDNGLVSTVAQPTELMESMGAVDAGGAVTVSLSPFSTTHDIDQLIRAMASLA